MVERLGGLRAFWSAHLFLRVVIEAVALSVAILALFAAYPARAAIPDAARQYRRDYVRIVREEMGLAAPVASLAAQIEQESAWNCRAVSWVGAKGCAQFMPTTADWIGTVDRRLAAGDVFSPRWAFRAQAVYMAWILDRVKGEGPCDQMAAALASYNAGLGWVQRAQRAAGTVRWLNGAERVNPGQSAAAFKESRAYPRRILGKLEPSYFRAGWGEGACS